MEELKDAITVCFIPFRFNSKDAMAEKKNSLWEIIDINVDKSFLHPYISNFLFGNLGITSEVPINPDNCLIYSLKNDWKGIVPDEEMPIRNLFGNYMLEIERAEVIEDDKKEPKYHFKLLNKRSALASPKLVVHQLSSVGFLMLCFEVDKRSRGFEDYIDLCHLLHKTGKHSPAIRISKDIEKKNNVYSSLKNYNRSNIKPFKKEKASDFFYLHNLISFLLKDIDKGKLTLSNKESMHLFSYIQVDSKEEESQQSEDRIKNFVRLVRCQDTKYMVTSEKDLSGDRIYMQTFDNIYVASCVEGGCIMTDMDINSPSFIKDFKSSSFISRYLWTYLLVYMQRTILINFSYILTGIDLYTVPNSKGKLMDSLLKLTKIKANTYFTDISDITQHNQFYRFCSKSLSIGQGFDEIRNKIEDMNIVIKEQELILRERELEIRDKELKQTEAAEQNEIKRSRKLSDTLVYIYIAQVFFAVVAFSGATIEVDFLSTFYRNYKLAIDIILSFIAFMSVALSCCLLYKSIKKK